MIALHVHQWLDYLISFSKSELKNLRNLLLTRFEPSRTYLYSHQLGRSRTPKICHFATLLEDALERCSGWVTETDVQIIIEESRRIEDSIDFTLSDHELHLRPDVDRFSLTAKKMVANIEESWEHNAAKMIEESIIKLCVSKTDNKSSPEEEDDGYSCSLMVGLSDQFLRIRDKLLIDDAEEFEYYASVYGIRGITTWISGMAGIGKTAFAKKLFHDPSVKAHFECRVFVGMNGDYVAFDKEKKIMEGDLDGSLRRLLNCSKSLIVFDDFREDHHSEIDYLYNTKIYYKGSRFLVTSRINRDYGFQMRFLNEEESCELLRREVFGEEDEDGDFPEELVKAGKKIAEECEGLPLLIIAVAPILLSKAEKDPESWKRVAEKPDSVLKEASHQISEVLLSNYHQLEEDLKLCFLYIAAFPKKYEVWVTTIAYLWYAEGFMYSWTDDAVYHLDSLLENNLVLPRLKGVVWHAEYLVKACSLHCAYWYVSRRVAENNKFLYTMNSLDDGLDERMKGHRRLAIYTNVLFAIKEVHDFIGSISTVRSLLCTGSYHPYQVPICLEYWRLLRVLDARTIRFYEFPGEVVKLICLNYLSLTCNADLPPSISKLWKLQFLFVHQHSSIKRVGVVSYLPEEIWHLHELEILQIMGRNLPDPPPGAVLPMLIKLLDVGVESCTEEVLESLPSLEKLRVQIELPASC